MENKVLEILIDYAEYEKLRQLVEKEIGEYKQNPELYDQLRVITDNDAYYYLIKKGLLPEKALYADTIFSFWIPYSELCHKVSGWKVYKTYRSIRALLDSGMKSPKYGEKIATVNTGIELFAQVCYTKGNFMLLPDRGMQCRGNYEDYRDCKGIQDRVDWSIYECFPGGQLAKYFSNDEKKLVNWIKEQKLESLFDGEIKKENLICVLKDKKVSELTLKEINEFLTKKISDMTSDEIWKYLKFAVKFINERTEKV